MALNNITLTAAMRSNLLALQGIAQDTAVTQQRLSTGKAVNSAVDNASAFFSAQAGYNQADALTQLKAAMGEGLQKINTALQATSTAASILKQMKSLADQALSTSDSTTKQSLQDQYNQLRTQLDNITQNDANYKGTNLLSHSAGNDLVISFNADSTSTITISAHDTTTTSYEPAAAANWATDNTQITAAQTATTSAVTSFNSLATSLGSYSSFIQTRINFTSELSSIFQSGADSLVNADMNQEGANMLALQTRQQLSVTALSLSSQANAAVLRLFQ
jgi:flagellin-like hook-associated protein FlgL